MRVLFIGGTGIISSACSPLAVQSGIELYLLNRGKSLRPTPAGAKVLQADINDPASVDAALGGLKFDAVVNWIAFHPDAIERDIKLFGPRTGQYVFISSASAYQTPAASLPITESTVLENPFWEYSRNKIACEERLVQEFRANKFPYTIIRPSHTYDQTCLPMDGGYTVVNRMRQGKRVVVHGDGSSIWVLTHHEDFAKGFVPLLGNSHVIGDAIHITSDELLTWDQIFDQVASAAGTVAKKVHVPSDAIARLDPGWGAGLLGDKTNSSIFDNSKIKHLVPGFAATIPFRRGAEEIMSWYDADPSRQKVDPRFDALEDELIAKFG